MGQIVSRSCHAPKPQRQPSQHTFNQVIPLLYNRLSCRDLQSLSQTNRSTCEAIDASELWRHQFAQRIQLPLNNVPAPPPTYRRVYTSGYATTRLPPYYKNLCHGMAILEQTSVRSRRLSAADAIILQEVRGYLQRNFADILAVAEQVTRGIEANHAYFNGRRAALPHVGETTFLGVVAGLNVGIGAIGIRMLIKMLMEHSVEIVGAGALGSLGVHLVLATIFLNVSIFAGIQAGVLGHAVCSDVRERQQLNQQEQEAIAAHTLQKLLKNHRMLRQVRPQPAMAAHPMGEALGLRTAQMGCSHGI